MKKYLLVLAMSALAPSVALAASGTISGRFNFTQQQKNCGTGTGAKFPCTQVGTERPVREALVEVRRASDAALLGSGYSDVNGDWFVSWADPSTSGNVSVAMWWRSQHNTDRFRVTDVNGDLFFFWVPTQTAVNGANTAIGTWSWGANPLANVYDGAVMMWKNSLSGSSRLVSNFGTFTPDGSGATAYVQIRAFQDDGFCPTGGAWGNLNRVCLPSSAWDQNHARVMHEMGHIAEYVSNRDRKRDPRVSDGTNNLYSFSDGLFQWNANTPEFYSVSFIEGMATHFASIGLYAKDATSPRSCIATSACNTTNGFDLEASTGDCANRRRWPIVGERYFWDLYDNRNSSNDTTSRSVGDFADTIAAAANGTGNRQKDEIWNSAFSTLDDREGRSLIDYREVLKGRGHDSTASLNNNCAPTGGSPAVD